MTVVAKFAEHPVLPAHDRSIGKPKSEGEKTLGVHREHCDSEVRSKLMSVVQIMFMTERAVTAYGWLTEPPLDNISIIPQVNR